MSVLCLVPTPLRAVRAARRLCDAETGILFGARVTTIDAFAPALLAGLGDRRKVLSPLAERLLALEAAEAVGGILAGLAPDGGLSRSLASALRELRRAEVGSAGVRRAAASASPHRPGAAERLESLAQALEAFEGRLDAAGALDRAGCVRAAADALVRGGSTEELRDLDLLVLEGFRSLPPAALDLVVSLAHRARRTHARVPFFSDRSDLCAPAEGLLRRLEGLHELTVQREVAISLEGIDVLGGRAPRLARMLRTVAGGPGGGPSGGEGLVSGAAGAGEEGEAEVAASAAAQLLERGFGTEEILFLAPAPWRVGPRLARACAALGVPLATGHGSPLSELPPVRAVLRALDAAIRPSRSALEAVLASTYLGLARAPARLGHWLDRAGAAEGRADPEQALRRRAGALASPAAAGERAALLRSAEAIACARRALTPLAAPGLARDHAARLSALLTGPGAGVRRRAARAEPDLARRDLAALGRLEEASEEIVRALALLGRAAEVLTAERWRALLDLALDGAGATPPPEPAAGALELWSLADAPGLAARAAIVLGCTRGGLPPPPPPEPLLRDEERAAVNRAAGRAALRSGPMARAEALHTSFCALAAGREALVLTWPGPGPNGAAEVPSPLAVEALAAAGAEVPAAPAAEPDRAGRRSVAAALRAAARGSLDHQGPALPADSPAPLRERLASALVRGAIELERRRAVLAGRASPLAGGLPGELLPALHRALPVEWSPSQLEMHARCPYRLFAAVVLRLDDPEAAGLDMDPRDEGRLAHAVLERFMRDRLARGALPLRGAPEEREALRGAAAELFGRFEADGRTGDPAVWAARRGGVLARLERVIASEAEESGSEAGGGAVPALLEYRFGESSGVPPLVFREPSGEEVRLRGRLDRVDASRDRIVLIDYKDSKARGDWKRKLEPSALGETNFQVPAYLMAAARALPGRSRLEATYLLLRSAERLEPFRAEVGDPLFASDVPARAMAREAGTMPFAEAVVGAVRRIRGGELPIASRDCTGCAFGALCRFESVAEATP